MLQKLKVFDNGPTHYCNSKKYVFLTPSRQSAHTMKYEIHTCITVNVINDHKTIQLLQKSKPYSQHNYPLQQCGYSWWKDVFPLLC